MLNRSNIPVEKINNQAVLDIEWDEVRKKRDRLISEMDKNYLRHSREIRTGKVPDDENNPTSLTTVQIQELDEYVQKLADIPQTYSLPADIVWPEKPTI